MLVDNPSVLRVDPILAMIAKVNNQNPVATRLAQGVYQVGHFGSSDFLLEWGNQWEVDLGDHSHYGVCDDLTNLLETIPLLQADPDRQFLVTLTRVDRDLSNKGQGGGWRWHKWGPYIGKKTPTTEYLDDEPEIDHIFVYHIYEKKQ